MKEWNYKEIFNTNFNLSFGRAKSENRCFCDKMKYTVLKITIHDAEKRKVINEWEIHKNLKDPTVRRFGKSFSV